MDVTSRGESLGAIIIIHPDLLVYQMGEKKRHRQSWSMASPAAGIGTFSDIRALAVVVEQRISGFHVRFPGSRSRY
jgi:hypothetical protein